MRTREEFSHLKQWEKEFITVFVPTMIGFTEWCIRQALRQKKKCLYFFARDGYLLYEIAKQLCCREHIDLDIRYLKVSRIALRSAEYHLMQEECLDYICAGGIDITFEKVMQRAGVSGQTAAETAKRAGYETSFRQILTYQAVVGLKDILRKDEVFLKEVYTNSKNNYPNVIGYLKQEGLLNCNSFAIVDMGWIGTLQKSLKTLMLSAGHQPQLDGYYFGLYEIPKMTDRRTYHAYYFMPTTQIRRKVYFSNSLLEAVWSAPEGMTVGYWKNESDGLYIPMETAYCNPNAERIRREKELLEFYFKTTPDKISITRRQIQKLLIPFMAHPTIEEVQFWGEYQFCDDVMEGQVQSVAAQLSEEEIKNQQFFPKMLRMLGIRSGEMHESAWIEGSIIKNGKNIRYHLRQAAWYKYILYLRKAVKQLCLR